MRFGPMFSLCLLVTACGGDSPNESGDSPDDGTTELDAGTGGGDTSNEDDADGQPGDEPGDDEPGDDQPGDDQPGDDQPGDDGPGIEDVWSCHTVITVGGNGETSTTCLEYRGEDAKTFAEPGCMDIAGSAERTLANAACPLEGAILRCDYPSQNSAGVFYADSSSQLDTLKMVCEQQGAVATVL
jgi:hypothetical protein